MELPKPAVGQPAAPHAPRPIRPLVECSQHSDVFRFQNSSVGPAALPVAALFWVGRPGPGTHRQLVIHTPILAETSHLTPNAPSIAASFWAALIVIAI